MSNNSHIQEATLGGGCFWCMEPVFKDLKGVIEVIPGYSGGHVPNPTYEQVCTDTTGHAEVVNIKFDPSQISFRDLLEVFFSVHDPTTPNRQGEDVGTQYRSIILYHDEEQRRIAQEVIEELTRNNVWKNPIVTQVVPFEAFYPAEEYHWDYFRRNPHQAYCRLVIAPKYEKFRKRYVDLIKQ